MSSPLNRKRRSHRWNSKKNEWAQQEQEIQEGLKGKSFWYADWGFPILVGIMSAAIFAGTHMYVVYGVGAFNEVSIVAMLKLV